MNKVALQIEVTEPVTIDITVFGLNWNQTLYPVPAVPTGLIVSTDQLDKILLQWSASQYAKTYEVWRDGQLLQTIAEIKFVDQPLEPGETHTYSVRAANDTGTSSASSTVTGVTPLPQHDVRVQIGVQEMVSKMRIGIVHADNALIWGDPTARATAIAAMKPACAIQKMYIQGWGPGRIWVYDGSPTGVLPTDVKTINYASTDRAIAILQQVGAPILISWFMLPWWMRQRLDGTYLTPQEEYSEQGRLRTDCISHWQALVQALAQRYLAAPYNVREFEVGAEPKGFYNRRDGKAQSWEYDDFIGTPGKADMGWTAFYKFTVEAVQKAADILKIPRSQLKFWAPYSTTPSRTISNASIPPVGHPLRDRPWGFAGKEWIEFTSKFLDLWAAQKFPLTGLMVDGGTGNRDGTPMDIWVAMTKLDDIMDWLHSEVARIGTPDLPIAWGEFYPNSQVVGTEQYRALVRMEGHRTMMRHGIDYLMAWQAQGPVPSATIPEGAVAQLYTDPKPATGGQPKPQLEALKIFHQNFPAGTPLYHVDIEGDGISAEASDAQVLLLNKTAGALRVLVGNKTVINVAADGYVLVPTSSL